MNMFINVCLESYECHPMFSKKCVCLCKVRRDYYIRFEVQKWYVMVVFLHSKAYVNRDGHMKFNVADLS